MPSCYVSIAKQLEKDYDMACWFENVSNASDFDCSAMSPRVTYAEWIVCLYEKNNKLYCIDFERGKIMEVVLAELLPYNDKFQAIDKDGNVVTDDSLHNYVDNNYCGESDDMSCYVYFNLVQN
jgi:hypothetical protein